MSHARNELDPLIHSPVRFSIMGYLNSVDECEFNVLRDAIGLSASSLSQNLTRLADAGYLVVQKRQSGRKVKTWISGTSIGEKALKRNLGILSQIAGV